MKKSVLWTMAAAAGLVVANNYYSQPLLASFATYFGVSQKAAGTVAVAAQAGYAIGLFLFVPLGDKIERRHLICLMLGLASIALVAMALSPTLPWLVAASLIVALVSVTPQLLTPFAAHLAGPDERGKAVGTVMFGLLCGILLSRTVSGFIGAHFGWQAVYWMGAAIMIGLIVVLSRMLPRDEPGFKGSYGELMKSLWTLYRTEPVIRETSAIGALQFAAFSGFWTTLSFHLAAMPQHYGSDVAGTFGLVGVVGASVAPYAGKFTDKRDPSFAVMVSCFVFVLAYLVFGFGGETMTALIAGVILLDFAAQCGHVSNMTRNIGLSPATMSRANTLYMSIRFAGGALGSALGSWAWSLWQWHGVCATGVILALLAVLVQRLAQRAARLKISIG
ncbi:MAG TPA: MFS transporter [Rhodocyclaceae bacterium]|nr:MFS transporter [Rhodocyclaceae bacterium]